MWKLNFRFLKSRMYNFKNDKVERILNLEFFRKKYFIVRNIEKYFKNIEISKISNIEILCWGNYGHKTEKKKSCTNLSFFDAVLFCLFLSMVPFCLFLNDVPFCRFSPVESFCLIYHKYHFVCFCLGTILSVLFCHDTVIN